MKIGVTGYKGKVGSALIKRGYEPLDCDITKIEEVAYAVQSMQPDIIIHCAALTDVDICEENPIEAHKVNCRGLNNVVDIVGGMERHPKLVFISSDHVFGGNKDWLSSEKHKTYPVNVYGLTKEIGESLILNFSYPPGYVIRTSKLFDYEFLKNGLNMLKTSVQFEETKLIRRSFLYMEHFIGGLVEFVSRIEEMPNLLHLASNDAMSYYLFWNMIARTFGYDENLVLRRDRELKDAVPRPMKGGLSIKLAKDLDLPIYSTHEGLLEIKKQYG